MTSEEQEWEDYSFIERAKLRKKTLEFMAEPTTPAKLAKHLNIALSEGSRILLELTKQGLAKCLTPKAKYNRYYALTERGLVLRKKFARYNVCLL